MFVDGECFKLRLENSLLVESGTTVLSATCEEGFAELRVQGEVKIFYNGDTYRYPIDFPDELKRKLEFFIDDGSYEVDMGNWYEIFVYDKNANMIASSADESYDGMEYDEIYDSVYAYMMQVLEEKNGKQTSRRRGTRICLPCLQQ